MHITNVINNLICKDLSPKIIDALELGVVDIRKFSCFLSVVHSYKNTYSILSPKELAIQVYTFGVEYKLRFSYGRGNGNWMLTTIL